MSALTSPFLTLGEALGSKIAKTDKGKAVSDATNKALFGTTDPSAALAGAVGGFTNKLLITGGLVLVGMFTISRLLK